jgi:hypothetical protein
MTSKCPAYHVQQLDWVPKVPSIKQCALVVCCTDEVKFMFLVDAGSWLVPEFF